MTERQLSPCIDQDLKQIEAYYRTAEVGAKAVVKQTQHGLLRYHVVEIEGVKPSAGRVYIANHGAFYMRSGANCFHPKGQTTLVVPTPEVLAWAEEHPRGSFDFSTLRPRGEPMPQDPASVRRDTGTISLPKHSGWR